jgi:hypothetical protein
VVNGRVKIRGHLGGGYHEVACAAGHSPDDTPENALAHRAPSFSTELLMRCMIMARGAMVLAFLIAACAVPSAPPNPGVDRPTTVEAFRQRPTVPGSFPDSVGIPPSIPPIYEEAPAGFDGPQ